MIRIASPGAQDCDTQAAADLLRALAHPMRLQILCRLLDGEISVAGFEAEFGLKQPNLSQQLAQLREAKLVTTRRQAKSIFYRLADQRVRIILAALREAMAGIKHAQGQGKPVDTAYPARPKNLASVHGLAETGISSEPTECGVFSVTGWAVAE